MGDFCTALGTWQTELTEGAPDFSDASDAEAAKDTLVTYLDGAVAATQTLVADIQAAGVPEVENGEAIATEMRSAIEAVGDDFAAAKADVEALSTDDPAAFAASLGELGTTLTEAGTAAGTAFDQLGEKYPAADLDAAATEAESCQSIIG
jgi:cell division septum initiation protein DivIVA